MKKDMKLLDTGIKFISHSYVKLFYKDIFGTVNVPIRVNWNYQSLLK